MKNIDTSVTHITSEEANIFEELGFNPIETSKLKIKAQLMCQIRPSKNDRKTTCQKQLRNLPMEK
ncbi:MAG: hypothetical protein D3916_09830 [Candidatus Electrothrix sp. MAN1_4]|nr:hypothetical protein [Candidatus Electrothrix sp. MAN1_4]